MQTLRYQLHKAVRHEEALLNYYRRTIDELKNEEVTSCLSKYLKEGEARITKIKELLRKHCSG
ncbi:MAG: hypothetical protein SCK28_09575 [Bacillota bacterium]|nr:hypothetical protein [Bacillota bacterium]